MISVVQKEMEFATPLGLGYGMNFKSHNWQT